MIQDYILRNIGALALGFLVVSCDNGPTQPTQVDTEQVQYAVVKYQFDHPSFDDLDSTYKAYYIGIAISDSFHRFHSVKDPTPALLKRFINNTPPVKKYSDGHFIDGGYYDNKTGERGVIFHVAQITWTSENTGQLVSGEYFGGRGADRYHFYVSKKYRLWSVDSIHWAGSS